MDQNTHSNWLMYVAMFIAGYWSMSLIVSNSRNITNNLNKLYQAIFMVLIMFVINNIHNYSYLIVGIIMCLIVIYLIRYQVFINDDQFLLSMIEHHQVALDMANRINEKTNNVNIKKLAGNIVNTQTQEIDYMNSLLYKN